VSEAEKPGFNPIFSQFVSMDLQETDRLAGIVAYGLYKIAKREWATDLFGREKRTPTEADLEGYIRTWTPSQIEGKREQAETILAQYANAVIEAASPDIQKEALKGSLWKAVGYGIATNVLYTLLLIAIVLVLKWAGVDILGLLEKAGPPH
jgi:hypothetical protein